MRNYLRIISTCILLIFCITLAGCETERSGEDIKITKDDMSNSVGEEKIDLGGKTITFEYVNQRISDDELEEINNKIGTKYNCRIEWKNVSSDYYYKKLIQDIISGVYKGDVIYIDDLIQPFFSIVETGALTALDEYINFEEGFFNYPIQERALWNGRHYGLSSFLGLTYQTNLLYYNKHLIEQKGLPDIFELQQRGEWTWEAFSDILQNVTSDTDGDGVTDVWGIAVPNLGMFFTDLVYSNGSLLTGYDDTGRFVSNIAEPAIVETAEFMHELLNVHKSVLTGNNIKETMTVTLFEQNVIAFSSGYTSLLLRNEPLYGMVFYPKGPRASDYSSVYSAGAVFAIPSSVENKKEIAVVLGEAIKFLDLDYEHNYLAVMKEIHNTDNFLTIEQAVEKAKFTQFDYWQLIEECNSIANKIMKGEENIEEMLNKESTSLQTRLNGYNMRR